MTAQQGEACENTLKDEPSAAAEDGCSPTIPKLPPKLDFNCGQQTTSNKELMKLVARYFLST